MKFVFFIISIYLYSYSIHSAETIFLKVHKGRAQYGSNQSQDAGCRLAEQELLKSARRKISGGEILGGETLKNCKMSNDYAKCEMFTNSFHSLGKIAIIEYKKIGKCTFAALGGNIFEATVTADITLKKLKEVSDNFDFKYRISKDKFISYPQDKISLIKENDTLTMQVEPMEDMYITVFQWWPYIDQDSVQRVFPNEYDTDNYFLAKQGYSIPTKNKKLNYRFRADFPSEIIDPDVQEFLMFIGTQEPVDFLDEYNFDEINEKIFDISESKKNKIRKNLISYIIINRLNPS